MCVSKVILRDSVSTLFACFRYESDTWFLHLEGPFRTLTAKKALVSPTRMINDSIFDSRVSSFDARRRQRLTMTTQISTQARQTSFHGYMLIKSLLEFSQTAPTRTRTTTLLSFYFSPCFPNRFASRLPCGVCRLFRSWLGLLPLLPLPQRPNVDEPWRAMSFGPCPKPFASKANSNFDGKCAWISVEMHQPVLHSWFIFNNTVSCWKASSSTGRGPCPCP